MAKKEQQKNSTKEETKIIDNKNIDNKKSNNLLIIFIIIMLLIIIVSGFFLFLLISKKTEIVENDVVETNIQQSRNIEPNHKFKKTYKEKEFNSNDKIVKLKDVEILFPLDIFIVNLKSDNGRRYLKTEIHIEFNDKEFNIELNNKMPVIRDNIIRTLTSKTMDELFTIKGKDKLSEEIINNLNNLIGNNTIKNIYFNEFIIQ